METENIPAWEKACLTMREAAEYSNIGEKKIRSIVKNQECDFVLKVGAKTLIKRKPFERFLDQSYQL